MRLGVALGMVLAAAAMLTAGGLLLIYSLYGWLATLVPAALAACLCGLTALLIAWLLISLAQRYADQE